MSPATSPSTSATSARTLWLVRHGESTWNTLGLTQGHNDQAELTGRGLRQAEEVAVRFAGIAVRAVYASDLRRAQQTAAPLATGAGVPVMLDARLRERSLGVLEGTPASGNGPAVTGLDLKAGLLVDPDIRPDGGESVRDLYRRAASFCDDLRLSLGGTTPWQCSSGGHPPDPRTRCAPDGKGRHLIGRAGGLLGGRADGDIVVVAHGGTLRVLRAYLSAVPVEEMDWAPLANATVLEFPNFGVTTREGAR